jgi:hypothetical protein
MVSLCPQPFVNERRRSNNPSARRTREWKATSRDSARCRSHLPAPSGGRTCDVSDGIQGTSSSNDTATRVDYSQDQTPLSGQHYSVVVDSQGDGNSSWPVSVRNG